MNHSFALDQALEAVQSLADPQPAWGDVLQSAQRLIGADSAAFLMFDGAGALMEFEQRDLDPAGDSAYVNHFFREDIITPHAIELPEGQWLDTREHYSEAALSGNSYYVDFMCKYRMRQMFTFVIEQGPKRRAALTFHRAVPVEHARRRLESQPIASFTRALQDAVARRQEAARQRLHSAASAFDSFGEATWLATLSGTVLSLSSKAQASMDTGARPSLRLQNGRLWHPEAKVREALAVALLAAAQGRQPAKLVIRRERGGPDIFELVRADPQLCLGKETLVLVRQRRHLASEDVPVDVLCATFDITRAEARVLTALMAGKSPNEYAREQGVSIHTIRTQIAKLMEKMSCTRQVDLVRIGLSVL